MGDRTIELEAQKPPSIDHLFQILANSRRRFILNYLCMNPFPAPVELIADEIVAHEYDDSLPVRTTNGVDSNESSDRLEGKANMDRERIESSLRHVHLPLLVDTDLIRWNHNTDVVVISQHARHLPILSRLEDSRLQQTFIGS